MRRLILLAAIIVVTILPMSTFAAVIYDNGGPDINSYSFFNDPTYSVYRNADNFILESGTNVITDIHWWGQYPWGNTENSNDFTITIYDTAAAAFLPGSVVYSNNIGDIIGTKIGTSTYNYYDIYYYSVFVDPINLTAGDYYWLEIMSNTTPDNDNSYWAWMASPTEASHAIYGLDGDYWAPIYNKLAFNLTNDSVQAPEPGTLLLLGLGITGLAVIRKKI